MNLAFLPNFITLLRFLLAIPIFISLLQQQFGYALFFVLVAAFSDNVDGFLARRYGWITEFGAYLDPLADKVLMFVTYGMLTYVNQLPFWLFIVIAGRDVLIILGVCLYRLLGGDRSIHARWLSKINTFLQLALALFVLLNLAVALIFPAIILNGLMLLILVFCILSFLDYAIIFYQQILRK